MTKRRVVVTGLGAVTPLGVNVKQSWQAVLAGQSGIRLPQDLASQQALRSRICGRVPDFDVTQAMPPKEAKKADVFIHYGMASAAEALLDSGLEITEQRAERIGVAVGSGIGGLSTIEANHNILLTTGPRRVSPFFIPASIANMVAGQISIYHGLKGPNISIVTACTTGTHNIGYAARTIAYGDADVMLAGGAECASSLLGMSGFASARALSSRNDAPEAASRPWDKGRDGFVLSDGAGVLVLEEYEYAKARGATIYAELCGFGLTADAYHMTLPSGDGATRAMLSALADAKMSPDAVDYINAHATSTPLGDTAEIASVSDAFGNHCPHLTMSSTKSMTGHMLGAAGAVEAIFSVLSIRDQVAPPTINLVDAEDSCGIDLVPNTAKSLPIRVAMSNSFGFGGTNGTLVFQKI